MNKNNFKKPDIKISLDFTEENLGYPINNNITDDDILYYWGKKITIGNREKPMYQSNRRNEIVKNPSREAIIQYAKDHSRPILPDNEEFIPRKYWAPINDLNGENLNVLNHPIWNLTQRIIKENYIPSSKNLIIQACGNNKPYLDNIAYNFTLKRHLEKYCDLVVNSIELVPIEFTIYYPFRFYDWSHLKETPFVTECLIEKNFNRITSFINEFHYKNIILLSPPFTDLYIKLYNKLIENYKNSDVNIHFIFDDEMIEKCHSWIGARSKGILKSRYFNFSPVKDKIDELLGIEMNKKPRISKKNIRKAIMNGVSKNELLAKYNVEKKYIDFVSSELKRELKEGKI